MKMKTKVLLLFLAFVVWMPLSAQDETPYIEVTGTSEIEIVPDRIHLLIEIREYFKEEFEGKSKPENYRTKVPLANIERSLRAVLMAAGILPDDIRTQKVGDYWREQGQDFLVSKRLDITLRDFSQIDEIVSRLDTKGIQTMSVGDLECDDIQAYQKSGKIQAVKAARDKAAYLAEALGKKLGDVVRIVEDGGAGTIVPHSLQTNAFLSDAQSFTEFRTIKKIYTVLVRFKIEN